MMYIDTDSGDNNNRGYFVMLQNFWEASAINLKKSIFDNDLSDQILYHMMTRGNPFVHALICFNFTISL